MATLLYMKCKYQIGISVSIVDDNFEISALLQNVVEIFFQITEFNYHEILLKKLKSGMYKRNDY